MTQTRPPSSPPDTPRARPQLFGASASPQAHADFENSILATIDGGQARLTRKAKRPRKSRLPMILLSAAALGVAVYAMAPIGPPSFSMAWFQDLHRPEAAPATVTPAPAMPDTRVAQAEPAPDLLAPGATIEVVPVPPAAEALPPTSSPPADAAPPEASDGAPATPLALSSAEAPPLATPTESPAQAPVPASPPATPVTPESPARPAAVTAPLADTRGQPPKAPAQAETRNRPPSRSSVPPPQSKTRVAKKPAAEPGAESDAALLAAVLPHFQRPEPTSRAFEQRCGQLTGSAAASCRKRFCSGRQGADTACPEPEATPLPAAPANSLE